MLCCIYGKRSTGAPLLGRQDKMQKVDLTAEECAKICKGCRLTRPAGPDLLTGLSASQEIRQAATSGSVTSSVAVAGYSEADFKKLAKCSTPECYKGSTEPLSKAGQGRMLPRHAISAKVPRLSMKLRDLSDRLKLLHQPSREGHRIQRDFRRPT